MRSRYSAYVLGLRDYLADTWHPATRPAPFELDASPHLRWLGLDVKRHVDGGDGTAVVEFVARYRVGGAVARAEPLRARGRAVAVRGGRVPFLTVALPAPVARARQATATARSPDATQCNASRTPGCRMDVEALLKAALREAGYGPDAIGSALPRIMRILQAEDVRMEVGRSLSRKEREYVRVQLELGVDVSEIVAGLKR